MRFCLRRSLGEIEENNPNFKFTPVISKPTEKWEGRIGYTQDNLDGVDVLNSGVLCLRFVSNGGRG